MTGCTCYMCGLDYGDAGPPCPHCGSYTYVLPPLPPNTPPKPRNPDQVFHTDIPPRPFFPLMPQSGPNDRYMADLDDYHVDRTRWDEWVADKSL